MRDKDSWFWSVIHASIPKTEKYTIQEHFRHLNESLSSLTDDELLDFHEIFEIKMIESYTPSLWNAGYIMANGMGDDDFDNFRSALIAHGSEVFNSAIESPDFLATYPLSDTLIHNEYFYNPVYDTVVERHNEEYVLEKLNFQKLPEIKADQLSESEDFLRNSYPALFSKFWKLT